MTQGELTKGPRVKLPNLSPQHHGYPPIPPESSKLQTQIIPTFIMLSPAFLIPSCPGSF